MMQFITNATHLNSIYGKCIKKLRSSIRRTCFFTRVVIDSLGGDTSRRKAINQQTQNQQLFTYTLCLSLVHM